MGIEQGKRLAEEVSQLRVQPELVVVSPLRRAIHTAQLGFRPDGQQPATVFTAAPTAPTAPPFVCTELARERVSFHTCDGRRTKAEIAADFPFVDLSEVISEDDAMWNVKEDVPTEAASEACAVRAVELLQWLKARPV